MSASRISVKFVVGDEESRHDRAGVSRTLRRGVGRVEAWLAQILFGRVIYFEELTFSTYSGSARASASGSFS